MKQLLLLSGLIFMIIVSCKKDTTNSVFRGFYIEVSPIAGCSQLNFINNNLLVKTEKGSSYRDSFYYSFSTETTKIILTPAWTNQYPAQSFDFKKIDENSFQIQDLYPSIPEAPESYMIFKK